MMQTKSMKRWIAEKLIYALLMTSILFMVTVICTCLVLVDHDIRGVVAGIIIIPMAVRAFVTVTVPDIIQIVGLMKDMRMGLSEKEVIVSWTRRDHLDLWKRTYFLLLQVRDEPREKPYIYFPDACIAALKGDDRIVIQYYPHSRVITSYTVIRNENDTAKKHSKPKALNGKGIDAKNGPCRIEGKEHMTICMSKCSKGISYFCVLFFSILLIVIPVISRGTVTFGEWLPFLLFLLLGITAVLHAELWKLDIYRHKDYFLFRTVFLGTRKIRYSECKGYKVGRESLILKTGKGMIFIEYRAKNYGCMLEMLEQHGIVCLNRR